MKHHLIVSSLFTGGKESAHGQEIIQAVSLNLNNVSVSESEGPGHAEALTRLALQNGAESILVAAGDSTINEVVNGFFEDGVPVAGKPHLGVIPTKAGGDIARSAGMPEQLMEAVGRIGSNKPKSIDLGRVVAADGKTRYFANAATTGISAAIGKTNRRLQWLNEIDGDLSFNWSVLKNSLTHNRFPLQISIPGGPQELTWDANCAAICNGNVLGGGIHVPEGTDISDGFLDVIVIHDFSKVDFIKGLKQIREGDSSSFEQGMSTIRASKIVLSSKDKSHKIPLDVDGQFSSHLPARFDVIPDAAMLF